MRVTAKDQGIPQKSAQVDVQVNVLRNQFKPIFQQNLYEVTVDERMAYGTVVMNVSASDSDSTEQPGVSAQIIA